MGRHHHHTGGMKTPLPCTFIVVLSALATLALLSKFPQVLKGEALRYSWNWIPTLQVSLSFN